MTGFEIKFQIDVGEISFLAAKQTSLDDLFYLEAYCKEPGEESEKRLWNSVHLKAVTESQPEYRFANFGYSEIYRISVIFKTSGIISG